MPPPKKNLLHIREEGELEERGWHCSMKIHQALGFGFDSPQCISAVSTQSLCILENADWFTIGIEKKRKRERTISCICFVRKTVSHRIKSRIQREGMRETEGQTDAAVWAQVCGLMPRGARQCDVMLLLVSSVLVVELTEFGLTHWWMWRKVPQGGILFGAPGLRFNSHSMTSSPGLLNNSSNIKTCRKTQVHARCSHVWMLFTRAFITVHVAGCYSLRLTSMFTVKVKEIYCAANWT